MNGRLLNLLLLFFATSTSAMVAMENSTQFPSNSSKWTEEKQVQLEKELSEKLKAERPLSKETLNKLYMEEVCNPETRLLKDFLKSPKNTQDLKTKRALKQIISYQEEKTGNSFLLISALEEKPGLFITLIKNGATDKPNKNNQTLSSIIFERKRMETSCFFPYLLYLALKIDNCEIFTSLLKKSEANQKILDMENGWEFVDEVQGKDDLKNHPNVFLIKDADFIVKKLFLLFKNKKSAILKYLFENAKTSTYAQWLVSKIISYQDETLNKTCASSFLQVAIQTDNPEIYFFLIQSSVTSTSEDDCSRNSKEILYTDKSPKIFEQLPKELERKIKNVMATRELKRQAETKFNDIQHEATSVKGHDVKVRQTENELNLARDNNETAKEEMNTLNDIIKSMVTNTDKRIDGKQEELQQAQKLTKEENKLKPYKDALERAQHEKSVTLKLAYEKVLKENPLSDYQKKI
jgi:hypothetical protein